MTNSSRGCAARAARMSKFAAPPGVIRHIVWFTRGTIVTYNGSVRTEISYRKLKRLNSVPKLEAAFKALGFQLTEGTANKVVYEKSARGVNDVAPAV